MATFTTLPPLCVTSCRPLSHPFYPAALRTVWVSMRLGSSSHTRARAADVAGGDANCVRVDPPLLRTFFFFFCPLSSPPRAHCEVFHAVWEETWKHFDAHNTYECPSYPHCRSLGSSISCRGLMQIRHIRYADAFVK